MRFLYGRNCYQRKLLRLQYLPTVKPLTTAKRLRQFFEEFLPDEIDELVENLNDYRSSLKDSFHQKVVHLNALTKSLITK